MSWGFGGRSQRVARSAMVQRSEWAGRPKQRRYTFGDHWNTAHVWAQQNPETYSGQSGDGRINFEGPVIYSFGDHFPMARFVGTYQGRRVVLVNSDKYSVSTTQHQSCTSGALKRVQPDADITISLPTKFLSNARLTQRERTQVQEIILEQVAVHDAWGTHPDSYERTRANEMREVLAAFRAIYKPRMKVPRNVVAWSKKRAAAFARKEFLSEVRKAYRFAKQYKGADPTLAAPDSEDAAMSAWNVQQRIAEFNRERRKIYSTRSILAKHGAAQSTITSLSQAIKYLFATRKPWEQLLVTAQYRERRESDLDDIRHIMSVGTQGRYHAISDLGHLWSVAIREGMADAAAEIGRQVHVKSWEREVPETFKRFEHPNDVTAEEWEAGKGSGYQYRFRHVDRAWSTLVRRKGDQLQTSQGASCPWSHAVAAFLVAQNCRQWGETYQSNGHSIRVGHFKVDRIEADGTLKAGCHTIPFANMLRLAVKEVPERVQATYPVPAVLA